MRDACETKWVVSDGFLSLRCYRRALWCPFLFPRHAYQDVRKLARGCSGPAELAGILVGDVILGINYKPLEKGLVHTSTLLAEAISLAGFVKLQVSEGTRAGQTPDPGDTLLSVGF